MNPIDTKLFGQWLHEQNPVNLTNNIACPSEINTDSRTIRPGQFYLPLYGEKFDGHTFINMAIEKGAAGFFYEKSKTHQLGHLNLSKGIGIDHSLQTLQTIASGYRQLFNAPVIALTGSVGKTTAKALLASILGQKNQILVTQGNENNEIGVPKTLLRMRPEHRFTILEFGARHEKDIQILANIACPTHRLLLNIGSAHLGEFGSPEILAQTKLEMFQYAKSADTLIANADDLRIARWFAENKKTAIAFGYNPKAKIMIKRFDNQYIHLCMGTKSLAIKRGFSHASAPINFAAAAAVAHSLGISHEQIATGLSAFRGLEGRFQIHQLKNKIVIDDTYNANMESMIAGLSSIEQSFNSQSKTLILGDMLEQGEVEISNHKKIGDLCRKISNLRHLVTVGNLSEYIGKQIETEQSIDWQHYTTAEQAIQHIEAWENSELIYAKASNGIGLISIIQRFLA